MEPGSRTTFKVIVKSPNMSFTFFLVLLHVRLDIGMNDLHYIRWIIKDKELDRIRDMNINDFELGPHKYIDTLPFHLGIYPFGKDNHNNSFIIYLYCDALYHNISKLNIKYTISIYEMNFTFTSTEDYTNFPRGWGSPSDLVKSNDIIKLNQITINAVFSILKMDDLNNNSIPKILWDKHLNINNNIENKLNELLSDKLDRKCDFGIKNKIKTDQKQKRINTNIIDYEMDTKDNVNSLSFKMNYNQKTAVMDFWHAKKMVI